MGGHSKELENTVKETFNALIGLGKVDWLFDDIDFESLQKKPKNPCAEDQPQEQDSLPISDETNKTLSDFLFGKEFFKLPSLRHTCEVQNRNKVKKKCSHGAQHSGQSKCQKCKCLSTRNLSGELANILMLALTGREIQQGSNIKKSRVEVCNELRKKYDTCRTQKLSSATPNFAALLLLSELHDFHVNRSISRDVFLKWFGDCIREALTEKTKTKEAIAAALRPLLPIDNQTDESREPQEGDSEEDSGGSPTDDPGSGSDSHEGNGDDNSSTQDGSEDSFGGSFDETSSDDALTDEGTVQGSGYMFLLYCLHGKLELAKTTLGIETLPQDIMGWALRVAFKARQLHVVRWLLELLWTAKERASALLSLLSDFKGDPELFFQHPCLHEFIEAFLLAPIRAKEFVAKDVCPRRVSDPVRLLVTAISMDILDADKLKVECRLLHLQEQFFCVLFVSASLKRHFEMSPKKAEQETTLKPSELRQIEKSMSEPHTISIPFERFSARCRRAAYYIEMVKLQHREKKIRLLALRESIRRGGIHRDVEFALTQTCGQALEYLDDAQRDDPEIVVSAVLEDGLALRFASDRMKDDINVVLAAVESDCMALQFASDSLRNNKDLVLTAVQQRTHKHGVLQHAGDEMRDDRDVVLAAVHSEYRANVGFSTNFQFASAALRNDREVVLAAVRQSGLSLKFASAEMQMQKDIVLAAVKTDGAALEFASPELQGDKDVVLNAVQRCGSSLQFASEELRQSRDVVLVSMTSGSACDAFEFIGDALEGDPVIFYFAFHRFLQNKSRKSLESLTRLVGDDMNLQRILEKVPEPPPCDRRVWEDVNSLSEEDITAIAFPCGLFSSESALPSLFTDKVQQQQQISLFMENLRRVHNDSRFLETLQQLHDLDEISLLLSKQQQLQYLNDIISIGSFPILGLFDRTFHSNEDVVLQGVRTCGLSLYLASPDLQENRDVVLAAMRHSPFSLCFAGAAARNDPDVFLQATESEIVGVLRGCAEDMDTDQAISVVRNDGKKLKDLARRFKHDRDVVLTAVENFPSALKFASQTLKDDKNIVLAAVSTEGRALQFASFRLREDRDVVRAAIRQDCSALRHATYKMKSDVAVLREAVGIYEYAFSYREDADEIPLAFACGPPRYDKALILELIQKCGKALRFAGIDLQGDIDVLLSASTEFIPGLGALGPRVCSFLHFADPLALDCDELAEIYEGCIDWPSYMGDSQRKSKTSKLSLFELEKNFFHVKELEPRDLVHFEDDDDIFSHAVKNDGMALAFASTRLRGDRDLVLTAVRENCFALLFAAEYLQRDRDVVLVAAQQGLPMSFVGEEFQSDKVVVIAATLHRADDFIRVSGELQMNKEFVLAAVQHCGEILQYVAEEFKMDKEVALAAVQRKGCALDFVADELKRDKEVVLAAVMANGNALRYAGDELKRDEDVVLAAVQHCGDALQYVAEELKMDKDVVLAAVQRSNNALEFAADELKSDKNVVLVAVRANGNALRYAGDELKRDEDVVLAAVQHCGDALQYVAEELKMDKDVVLAAVQHCGDALRYAGDELKRDKEVVLAAVQHCRDALKYVAEELKMDKDVVLPAVQHCGDALCYAGDELKRDKEVVLAAVQTNGYALSFAGDELKRDKDVVLAAVQSNGRMLDCAGDELKRDKDVVLAAVNNFGYALSYAGDELKRDKDVVLAAVRQSCIALQFASLDLKRDKDVLRAAAHGNGVKSSAPDQDWEREEQMDAKDENKMCQRYRHSPLKRRLGCSDDGFTGWRGKRLRETILLIADDLIRRNSRKRRLCTTRSSCDMQEKKLWTFLSFVAGGGFTADFCGMDVGMEENRPFFFSSEKRLRKSWISFVD